MILHSMAKGSRSQPEADTKATLNFTYNNGTTGINGNNAQQITLTQVQEAVDTTTSRMYGQAEFALKKDFVKDGGTLTIGDETYVFAVGADSKYKDLANDGQICRFAAGCCKPLDHGCPR